MCTFLLLLFLEVLARGSGIIVIRRGGTSVGAFPGLTCGKSGSATMVMPVQGGQNDDALLARRLRWSGGLASASDVPASDAACGDGFVSLAIGGVAVSASESAKAFSHGRLPDMAVDDWEMAEFDTIS